MFVGHTRFSLFVPDSASWRASNEQSGFQKTNTVITFTQMRAYRYALISF